MQEKSSLMKPSLARLENKYDELVSFACPNKGAIMILFDDKKEIKDKYLILGSVALKGIVYYVGVDLLKSGVELMAFPLETIEMLSQGGLCTFDLPLKNASIIDPEALEERYRKPYLKLRDVMYEVRDVFEGNCYLVLMNTKKNQKFKDILSRHSVSNALFWKWFPIWLKSNYDDTVFVDKRCAGFHSRKKHNTKVGAGRVKYYGVKVSLVEREYIKEQIAEFYAVNGEIEKRDLYRDLLALHYTKYIYDETLNQILDIDASAEECFSYETFLYWFNSMIPLEEQKKIKLGDRAYNNDERALFGSDDFLAYRPGWKCEIDAWEACVSTVDSEGNRQSVGGPIIYAMIDVYSRMILAISVSYENNSCNALKKLFLNLVENKTDFCKRYGIKLEKPELWPSGIIPKRIHVDHGADFQSDAFKEFCRIMNINRILCRPGTGSYKGVVEQLFNQMRRHLTSRLYRQGLKTGKYGSNPNEEAILDIEDITRLMIEFVKIHNQALLSYRKPSKDEMKSGVLMRPVDLWKFGVEHYGAPRSIINDSQFVIALLTSTTASVTRAGIEFNGLTYSDRGDPIMTGLQIKAKKGRFKIKIKFDPSNLTKIYYLESEASGKYIPLKIAKNHASEGIESLDFEDLCRLKEKMREKNIRAKLEDDFRKGKQRQKDMNLIETKKTVHYAGTKSIKENRKKEIEKQNMENGPAAVLARIDKPLNSETDHIEEIKNTESEVPQNKYEEINILIDDGFD